MPKPKPSSSAKPWPEIVSRISCHLENWLASRAGRLPIVQGEVLTWEEMAAPDGMLVAWLWHLKSTRQLPCGVVMALWMENTALTQMVPLLIVPDAGLPDLLSRLERVWEDCEAASSGPTVDVSFWYQSVLSAAMASLDDC